MMKIKSLLLLVLFLLISVNITACSSSDIQNSGRHGIYVNDSTTMDMHNDDNINSKNVQQSLNHNDKTLNYYYTCPMHPEIRQDKPGTCPKCGMFLEKVEINKEKQS